MVLSRRNPRVRAQLVRLTEQPFAHRGLHGEGRIENSRAAFAAAIARGHGIELDVQASKDGQAFVIHDEDLGRLSEEQGPVADRTAAELLAIRLRGSEETVPPLSEILRLIDGRSPLLIELKAPDRAVARLCLSVFRCLEAYRGPVAIMSFNPEVGHWFSRHAPRTPRATHPARPGRHRKRQARPARPRRTAARLVAGAAGFSWL
jgi:glycerophosphoryl diester phosphodiesterase